MSNSTTELRREGVLTTLGSVVGLSFGPSVIAILAISPFIPPIEAEFGWSRVQVSLAATIVSYMVVFVSPLQGFLVDRLGPRKVILTSIPLFALSLASLYWLPDSLPIYYTIWVLIPLFSIGLWPLGYLQAVSQWFEKKLGLALGCANAGIGVGSTIVPLIVAALIAGYDWRTAFLGLAAIVFFVTWPVTFFTIKELSGEEIQATKRSASGTPFRDAIREPVFFMLCAAFFLLGLTATSLVTQQVPLLIEAGWSQTDASFVQALFGFALLFARVFIGFIIDHFFAPRVMQIVSVGGAVSCVLYAIAPDAGILSALLLGFLLGAEFDVLAFLIKRYFGNVAYGRLYGVIFGVFYLGSGLGIVGLAAIRQAFGSYDAGLFMAAGILLSCVVLTAFFPDYRYKAT
ncbi:MAG: MFS transporter [Gammaproteobacteria bacterium]|nr:MFS transporter [Gammaproteobacteria bacterium]